MSKKGKGKKKNEEVLSVDDVISFEEFLNFLPINSIQSNTWLSYNVLWYASRCLIFIREGQEWHNIPYVFSSRLAVAREFLNFSDIATNAWCQEHRTLFSGVQFNAEAATLDGFQVQAAIAGGFSLEQPDVAPFLDWETFQSDWRELFAMRVAQLYSVALAMQINNDCDLKPRRKSKNGRPSSQQKCNTPANELNGTSSQPGVEDRVNQLDCSMKSGEFEVIQDEIYNKCISACAMTSNLASNLQRLSDLSNMITGSITSGFDAFRDKQYSPHGKLVKLLMDNWGYLPPTLQLADPKSIVDVVTKHREYSNYMRSSSELEQLNSVEYIWNTYLLKAVMDSGNFDENATKIKSVNVEELSAIAARRTLAESGVDSSLPAMIRKIGDELKVMNVQSISKSKETTNAVNIPDAVVAHSSEEAKRLLSGKKKQEVQQAVRNDDSMIAKYLSMSDHEVFMLDYEEQQLALEIRGKYE